MYIDNRAEHFNTLEAAQEAIHATKLVDWAGVSLDLPVLTDSGEEVIIRRIHSGTGQWLFTPQPVCSLYRVYKPGDTVQQLFADRDRLNAELHFVTKALDSRMISVSRVYFNHSSRSEAIERAYQLFRERYDAIGGTDAVV